MDGKYEEITYSYLVDRIGKNKDRCNCDQSSTELLSDGLDNKMPCYILDGTTSINDKTIYQTI